MSETATINRSYTQGGITKTGPETITSDTGAVVDTSVGANTANVHIVRPITRSLMESCMIYADLTGSGVTLYTNQPSGNTPQDTIVLGAGETRVWSLATDGIGACPFSANVTDFYLTNANSTNSSGFRFAAILHEGP